MEEPYLKMLREIREDMYRNPLDHMCLQWDCERTNLSYSSLTLYWKKYFGISHKRDCIRARMMQAEVLMRHTDMSVKQIAQACGFTGFEESFSAMYKRERGENPQKYMTRERKNEQTYVRRNEKTP